MNLPGKTTQAAKLDQVGSHQIWIQGIGLLQKIQFQIHPTGKSQPSTHLRWSPQPPQPPQKGAIASAVESSCKFVEATIERTTTNACSSSMPVRGTPRSKLSRKAAVVRAQQQQQLNRRLYNQTRTQPPQRTLSGWSFARGLSSRAPWTRLAFLTSSAAMASQIAQMDRQEYFGQG